MSSLSKQAVSVLVRIFANPDGISVDTTQLLLTQSHIRIDDVSLPFPWSAVEETCTLFDGDSNGYLHVNIDGGGEISAARLDDTCTRHLIRNRLVHW